MKKFLASVLTSLALVGCASTAKAPVETYASVWCELAVYALPDGVKVYLYTSPQGNLMIVRGPDGRMIGCATGRHVDTAVDNVLELLKKK